MHVPKTKNYFIIVLLLLNIIHNCFINENTFKKTIRFAIKKINKYI